MKIWLVWDCEKDSLIGAFMDKADAKIKLLQFLVEKEVKGRKYKVVLTEAIVK